jgi:hypothetical protein
MTSKSIDIKIEETKKRSIVPVVILIVLFIGIFFGGFFSYPKWHPCPACPEITRDTIFIYDTVIYNIPIDHYKIKRDTVIKSDTVLQEVDTVAILQLYYSTFQYTRTFEDSILKAVLQDRVTQNKPAVISFDYTIKRPQQIIQNIDNSISWSKYLYAGGSIVLPDAKYSSVSLYYASGREIYGFGYIPFQKGIVLSGGFKIINIR